MIRLLARLSLLPFLVPFAAGQVLRPPFAGLVVDEVQRVPCEVASEEWQRVFAAFDGTDHAWRFVEPLLEVVPELKWKLYRTRRGSHGPMGVEALVKCEAAEVRYYEFPGPWWGFGDPPAVGEFASGSGFPESFAFYVKYDELGRLVRCVEFDGLLRSGIGARDCIEDDERNEWRGGLLVRTERRWPYRDGSSVTEFEWDTDGLLRSWIDYADEQVVSKSQFEYSNGRLSGRRVFEGERQVTRYLIERDARSRITEVRREGAGHFMGGGTSTSYRYPESGGIQRITKWGADEVQGNHWQRGPDGAEIYCGFRFRLFEGEPVLEGTRTRYADQLKHIESFTVSVESIPTKIESVDPALLLESPAHSSWVRPKGIFWPEQQASLAHGVNEGFVMESDERGNWLTAGRIDAGTGEQRVTHARTIEYL